MSVLNITLRKDISEDEILWGATLEQSKCCTLPQVTEQSWVTQQSVIELCVMCVFIFLYANCQYLLIEENRVNECVNFCEVGWGY